MTMRRLVAAVVLGLLSHGAWASSAVLCPMGMASAVDAPADTVAAVAASAPAVPHHHGHGPVSPSVPAPDERGSTDRSGPSDASCLLALGCAPMVAPPVPAASPPPARLPSVVPPGADTWRDGIVPTVEPPPPRAK